MRAWNSQLKQVAVHVCLPHTQGTIRGNVQASALQRQSAHPMNIAKCHYSQEWKDEWQGRDFPAEHVHKRDIQLCQPPAKSLRCRGRGEKMGVEQPPSHAVGAFPCFFGRGAL